MRPNMPCGIPAFGWLNLDNIRPRIGQQPGAIRTGDGGGEIKHAQIGEGNLIELCRKCLPWIGEIQVADVPGRKEPGTGEVNWPAVARAEVSPALAAALKANAAPPAELPGHQSSHESGVS